MNEVNNEIVKYSAQFEGQEMLMSPENASILVRKYSN